MRLFEKTVIFTMLLILSSLELTSIMASDSDKMLIFVSPEYSGSEEVKNSIQRYIQSVQTRGPGWTSEIILLGQDLENNRYAIDRKIETEYRDTDGALKAVIIVGEDTDVYHENKRGKIVANTSPWEDTVGKEGIDSKEFNERGEMWSTSRQRWESDLQFYEYLPEVSVSLIFQDQNSKDKARRIENLIALFDKFSQRQGQRPSGKTIALSDTELTSVNLENHIRETVKRLDMFHVLARDPGLIDPLPQKVKDVIYEPCSVVGVFGHGNPRGVYQNLEYTSRTLFECQDFQRIQAPLTILSGCHVQGWYEDRLSPRGIPAYEFLGEGIFMNPKTHAIIAGLPTNMDYHRYVVEDLKKGKTISEAIIGKRQFASDNILFGDPTLLISIEEKK